MNNLKKHAPFFITATLLLVVIISFLIIKNTEKETPFTSQLVEALEECEGESVERIPCWERVLDENLSEVGLTASFDAIITMSEKSPTFAKQCHDFVHKVGYEAYNMFASQQSMEDFQLTRKAHYCSFGFYHGFMEMLFTQTGDLAKSREFCNYVDDQLSEESPGAVFACYHGIGHGFAENFGEHAWKDVDNIIQPSLNTCEEIAAGDAHFLKLCASGVFDTIAIAYYNKWYGLEVDPEDPYRICREQEEKHKRPCYSEMMTMTIWLGDHDLEKASFYLEEYGEQEHIVESMKDLADTSVRFLKDRVNMEESVQVCRERSANLRLPCISGLAEGLMQYGPPEREYWEAERFCNSSMLTEQERDACFSAALSYSTSLYSTEKVSHICDSVEEKFKKYCNK